MRMITKKVCQIVMTNEEMNAFIDMVMKAKEGQTVHAAECKLKDGSYLGVAIDDHANDPEMVPCWSCGNPRPATGKDAWMCPKCAAPKYGETKAKKY